MKRALLAAVLAALATGLVLATVGFGASTTATTAKKKGHAKTTQTQTGPPKTMAQVQQERDTARDAFYAKLGAKVNKTGAEVAAAFDKVQKDHLDADVAANRLTQAQEDAILACKTAPLTCDRSNLPAFGGPGGHGPMGGPDGDGPHGGPGDGTFVTDLATALGVPAADLKTALKALRPAPPKGARGHRFGGRPFGPPQGMPQGMGPQGSGARFGPPGAAPQGAAA